MTILNSILLRLGFISRAQAQDREWFLNGLIEATRLERDDLLKENESLIARIAVLEYRERNQP